MDQVLDGLEDFAAYIDDIVTFSTTWEEHLATVFARKEFQTPRTEGCAGISEAEWVLLALHPCIWSNGSPFV